MKARIKALLKRCVRPFWRLTAPLRRPLIRKFDEHIARQVEQALHAYWQDVHLTIDPPDLGGLDTMVHEMSASLSMARQIAEHHAEEANLLMDGLVREVARLQLQLEGLAEMVEELRGGSSLMLVSGEGDLKAG